MEQKVKLENWSKDGIEIVKVSGVMDMTQIQPFEELLNGLIKKGSVKIVLDFSGLKYISSSGLGVIIGCGREINEKAGDIIISGSSGSVLAVLNSVGFSAIFKMTASQQEALAQFRGAES